MYVGIKNFGTTYLQAKSVQCSCYADSEALFDMLLD